MSEKSLLVSEQFNRFGCCLGNLLLEKIKLINKCIGHSSVYTNETSSGDLNASQCFILALIYGLFTEDITLCTFLIQLSSSLERLKSTYLRVWLRDDYVFDKEDMERGLKTFVNLVSLEDLAVPESLVSILSGLAERYHINGFLATASHVTLPDNDPEDSLDSMLCLAVQNNCVADIINVATRGGNVNLKTASGESLYHLALSKGCLESINALGFLKANIEARNVNMVTPLQQAVEMDNVTAVMILLNMGADCKRRVRGGNALLHVATSRNCNKALKVLLETKVMEEGMIVRNHNGDTPIILALKKNNTKAVMLLIERGADPNGVSKDGETLLHTACTNSSNTEVVKCIIKKGAKTDVMNKTGLMPLHLCRNAQIIESMVSGGAVVDAMSSSRDTALHLVAAAGNVEAAEALINLGAFVDCKNGNGETPLILAASHNKLEIVQLLLASGADSTIKDNYGFSPVLKAAEYGGLAVLQSLEAKGADMMVTLNNNLNVLHIAAFHGYSNIVTWLLTCEVENILEVSCQFHSLKLNYCYSSNPSYNTINGPFSWKALHLASFQGHVSVVNILLENGAFVDDKDNYHLTPLHLAGFAGHVIVVEELIAHGSNVSNKSVKLQTACHLAADQGHLEVVRLLVEQGANINEPGCDGWTPLHHAAARDYIELVSFLLDHGANINCKTIYGNCTPLSLASLTNSSTVKNLLTTRGAI